MQTKVTNPSPTEAIISIEPTETEILSIKKHVLGHFQNQVKVPGFRTGKTPLELVEKHTDNNLLQSKFLDEAIEQLYRKAMQTNNLRPVDRPSISIKKFVPFSALEFQVSVPILGNIRLADYKKIKLAKTKIQITAKDINDVLKSLQSRMADKIDVDRQSKKGDQLWIDFSGSDTNGKPVSGADGKDYPLLLGSNTFIPGFEDNLLGLKANDEKTFTLTFPKDYGVKALAGSKVTFKVIVTKVQAVNEPKLDDEFAKKAGPFESLQSLKEDIRKQITIERQNQADRDYESELIKKISDKSHVDIPKVLVDEQLERMLKSERQNAIYRGQTWEEYLEREGMDEEALKAKMRPAAEERVKASVLLSEVAEIEDISFSREELDERIRVMKTQYQDAQMQAELDKDEARQDIASRMLTEKTIQRLVDYAIK